MDDKCDRWTPMIEASHPLKTGAHDAYATAMEMVGNRHSKGSLVDLVCWLVQRVNVAEAQLRASVVMPAAITSEQYSRLLSVALLLGDRLNAQLDALEAVSGAALPDATERVNVGELLLPGIRGEEYDEPELLTQMSVLDRLQERLVHDGRDRHLAVFVEVPVGVLESDGGQSK